MTRDTGVGLGLIALGGLYWLGAEQIRVSRLEGIVGAQAVPKSLAASLLILAVLLIVQDLWRARRPARSEEAAAGGTVLEEAPASAHGHLRALGMLLIGMAYLAVVGAVGYVPAIALLLLATALYMGRRWCIALIALSVAGAMFYYLMFVRLLGIPLPAGIWPGVWRALTG